MTSLSRNRSKTLRWVGAALVAGLTLGGLAVAQQDAAVGERASGSIIYRDPTTGALTDQRPPGVSPPTLLRRRSGTMRQHQLPGGRVRLELGDHFLTSTVIQKSEDGTLKTHCTHEHGEDLAQ